MGGGTVTGAHSHGVEDLCEAGERVHRVAMQAGRISRHQVSPAPCLVDLGLLHRDPADLDWYLPTRPEAVVARLVGSLKDEVEASARRLGAVAGLAQRLAEVEGGAFASGGGVKVLDGMDRIQAVIFEESAKCTSESLGIQPGGIRSGQTLAQAIRPVLDMGKRGVRVRSLYTHVSRHSPGMPAYLEQVGHIAEIRTLDEVGERLVVFDRTVAFVPAVRDRSAAFEIRIPALVDYFRGIFECLWGIALPMSEQDPVQSEIEGISHRERVIASLLAEGFTDLDVARRLGINVRTCRRHIANLAKVLGSSSRAQLGVRIARAGLDVPLGATVDAEG